MRACLIPFVLLFLSGCDGCGKKAATAEVATTTSGSPPPAATAPGEPTGAPTTTTTPGAATAKTLAVPKTDAGTTSATPASPTASASAAAVVPSADVAPAPLPAAGKSAYADEIPKPCNDGFGRLGLLTFTDLGGGKVKVSSNKNASAMCNRGAPTQYQCDWTIEGKPTGSFPARFDPAHKSVNGSSAKGQMLSCPPSSQK